METDQVNQEFQGILSEVSQIDSVPVESAVQVATVILREVGKYRRSKMLTECRLNNNSDQATEKQKNALKNFGIEFRNGITKQVASDLISEAIENSNGNRYQVPVRIP
jgi:hypothetical protein